MRNGFCPKYYLSFSFLASLLVLSACAPGEHRAQDLTEAITDPVGCQSPTVRRDQLWSALYKEAATYTNLPEKGAVAKSLRAKQPTEIAESYSGLYSEIFSALESANLDPSGAPSEGRRQLLLKHLAELELGDRTTQEKAAAQDQIESRFKHLATATAGAECPAPNPTPTENPPDPGTDPNADAVPLFEEFRESYAPAVYGAYKILSVGYQSCSFLDLAPLTSKTPTIEGIEVVGTHPSGGKQRIVASASDVLKTNPYYSIGRITPSGSCLPEQDNPLIYDFGGKPYVASNTSMEFDLFRNGGSGTAALGIDCSGLVSGALLASGLKLKKTASAKAYQVSGVSSSMLMDPAANGLSCLNRRSQIRPGDSLLAGDIIVQSGHVVMVDQVGDDPFGIAGIATSTDCTSTKISSTRFNFSITQSSASLGGIGMNRYLASSYLAGNSAMRNGLVEYAVAHCKAKFGVTATVPSTSTAVIVRHAGGTECSDRRVEVKYSSCMKDCARRETRSLASVR